MIDAAPLRAGDAISVAIAAIDRDIVVTRSGSTGSAMMPSGAFEREEGRFGRGRQIAMPYARLRSRSSSARRPGRDVQILASHPAGSQTMAGPVNGRIVLPRMATSAAAAGVQAEQMDEWPRRPRPQQPAPRPRNASAISSAPTRRSAARRVDRQSPLRARDPSTQLAGCDQKRPIFRRICPL